MTRPYYRLWLTAVSGASLWLIATLWFGAVTRSHAEAAGSTRITMKDFMFSPVPLTVHAGSTVTWTNLDAEPHTAVSDTGLFRSGAMDTNESFSFKFDKPGAYRFICSIHPRMVGTIIVQ